MRTSTTRQLPAKRLGAVEGIIAFVGLIALLLSGVIGHHNFGWTQETASLVSAGGAVGGLLVWWGIRTILVRGGLVHPLLIGPDPTS